jgi:hypothetical protein
MLFLGEGDRLPRQRKLLHEAKGGANVGIRRHSELMPESREHQTDTARASADVAGFGGAS